jgi:threonine/homoserine/homoserine lactone efflux protein
MSTFINTNIGETRKGIPISLVIAVLFVGLQLVIFIPSAITSLGSAETIYATPTAFNLVSLITGSLLLVYLVLDFWRWRQEGVGRFHHVAFIGTAALLVAILFFLGRAAGILPT